MTKKEFQKARKNKLANAQKHFKNCPVCNSKPEMTITKRLTTLDQNTEFGKNIFYHLQCYNCKENGTTTSTGSYTSSKDAVKAWNNKEIHIECTEAAA